MSEFIVVFQGRLGNNPEKKSTPNGAGYADMSIAHNIYKGKDADGDDKMATLWCNCRVWQHTISDKFLDTVKKGSLVNVTGAVTNLDAYTNRNNDPVPSLNIRVLSMSYADVVKVRDEESSKPTDADWVNRDEEECPF